ncbi:hypothetical protein V6N13_079282 [Hibiscus sabdariffa]
MQILAESVDKKSTTLIPPSKKGLPEFDIHLQLTPRHVLASAPAPFSSGFAFLSTLFVSGSACPPGSSQCF